MQANVCTELIQISKPRSPNMKQFYDCILISETEWDEWGLASSCEIIPFLPDEDSSNTKQTKAHFLFSFHVGTREPHTAFYKVLKADGCTVSAEQRWQLSVIRSLQVKLGSQSWHWRDPCDWGSGLKSLNDRYMEEAREQGNKKPGSWANILSHTDVSVLTCADMWTSCSASMNKNWFCCL